MRNRVRVELRSEIDELYARTRRSPDGAVVTVATVTSVNSPYTVLASDSLVKFDESNGLLATASLPAAPLVGERHTFKWWNWTIASPPPVIDGDGKQIESWPSPQGAQGLGATTTITTQGGQGTWEYDGTQWVLVGT